MVTDTISYKKINYNSIKDVLDKQVAVLLCIILIELSVLEVSKILAINI